MLAVAVGQDIKVRASQKNLVLSLAAVSVLLLQNVWVGEDDKQKNSLKKTIQKKSLA